MLHSNDLPEGEPLSWSALPKMGTVGGPVNVRNAAMNLSRRRVIRAISEKATHIRTSVLMAILFDDGWLRTKVWVLGAKRSGAAECLRPVKVSRAVDRSARASNGTVLSRLVGLRCRDFSPACDRRKKIEKIDESEITRREHSYAHLTRSRRLYCTPLWQLQLIWCARLARRALICRPGPSPIISLAHTHTRRTRPDQPLLRDRTGTPTLLRHHRLSRPHSI